MARNKPAQPIQPVTYECTSCGAVHQTSGGMPRGWSAVPAQDHLWCTDCAAAGIPARELRQRRMA